MAFSGLHVLSAPAAREPDATLAAPDRATELAAGRLILVAEDHPVNQELIRHQLALLGYACDVVNDGAEALAALAQHRYGCLITDCHMPNVSGYDLARSIRQREREGLSAPRLPILAITANTAPESLKLCDEAGIDECLVKPTRVATLRGHLARWFGMHRALETGGATEAVPDAALAAGGMEPLDLARMIQVWGSEATVKTLLGSFVSAVRGDLDALRPLLERPDLARLREWHHRLAGAVGVLQYPSLLTRLDTFRRHMETHTSEQLRVEGEELIRSCEAILDVIEQQTALLG
jgi:CheY-like chemotaxis protein